MTRISNPKILLHLEGLTFFLFSISVYFLVLKASLSFFLILFLAPDLTFLGYLINKKTGSYIYNAAHNYLFPILLLGLSFYYTSYFGNLGIELSMIWLSHIGIDRLLGYGLKYPDAFKNTHLNKV